MPAIKVTFPRSEWGSEASFDGMIEPSGATGYAFSGTLTATCKLNRIAEEFDNAVRLGHGGTSGTYSYIEQELVDWASHSFSVKGEGVRAPNETVDFHLGFNEGVTGKFNYADRVMSEVGGPSQKVLASYTTKDAFGNIAYDVRFDGTARADGPKNYVVEGSLDAYIMDGALTTQYVTIGHGSSSGSWHYVTYSSNDTPQSVKVFGTRKVGEKIMVVVGATSEVANLYGYGNAVTVEVPDLF
ncbi:hypothetical protein [Pseudomonas petrae]|uniref:hypothetical protein n=1 Tax=Pseudomonas petrae TaxID=2912190 RepID=UPI001EF0A6FC|nr:hypothetical protein [Pseudomonas petrae]MCF7533460.1 hypothetical protein [Pseudomonas petrae]MCF7537881.1 hypothetical protein [Pseudomonas petrae]MCF7555227.1 hypothetical protein [Pseudomonas petrae]